MNEVLVAEPTDIRYRFGDDRFQVRVGAVIIHNDHILMMSDSTSGFLYTVGGAVQFGEDSKAALMREVHEEIEATVTQTTLVAVQENFFEQRGDNCYEICFYYRVTLNMGPTLDSRYVANSVNMFGEPEHIVWVPREEYGIDCPAYPTFLPELFEGNEIRHYLTRG